MSLPKRYNPAQMEPEMKDRWQSAGTYHYDRQSPAPKYAIDSPPATVSGHLHLGHVYSYSHADFMARYFRMKGFNVFYPMGFDDNGLPTERLVEKRLKITAQQVGRKAFIEKCLEMSEEAEKDYRALWQRLGLSIDWRYTYRTIDDQSRKVSQYSFIELFRKGLSYRRKAPAIWCPECHTAIAQAELNDLNRTSEFVTLPFQIEGEETLRIATTRPELLSACVAVFVHPEDSRYSALIGKQARVPFYGQFVPVLADPAADPTKGTGAVMCCTFGDQTDLAWWQAHKLPLIEAIDLTGHMASAAGKLQGLSIHEARQKIKEILAGQGLILSRQPTEQSIRVHERCDTPVEYLMTQQWFIRVIEYKDTFLELGERLHWHPEHMHARYKAWVENLSWDWAISRQRYFGVAFPLWYCKACGEVMLADPEQLPIDPLESQPEKPCACGSTEFEPETDVMDTWATSSMSPEIVTGWLKDPELFESLFPMTLRPQAHEIIRTWAFYTIVKSYYHFGKLPWSDVFISGWGLAGEGMGKISKSRGGGPMPPMEMIDRYSADAVRYWAASTSPGKDSIISEEKIQMGSKLVTKLWNVARFSEPFITGDVPPAADGSFTPADRWILASCRSLIRRVTQAFESYEYANAKSDIEGFFWHDLADNYLEMAKLRLYDSQHPGHAGACQTLKTVFNTLLKLLAPLLPYVTEAIYGELFAQEEECNSIHKAQWPKEDEITGPANVGDIAEEALGELLVSIATAVRRFKSENALSLGTELARLCLAAGDPELANQLQAAGPDLMSVTRARNVVVSQQLEDGLMRLTSTSEALQIGIVPITPEN